MPILCDRVRFSLTYRAEDNRPGYPIPSYGLLAQSAVIEP